MVDESEGARHVRAGDGTGSRRVVVVAAAAVTVVAAAGCAGAFERDALRVASYQVHGDHVPDNPMTGTLEGSVAEDGESACLWLIPDDDVPGPRQYLVAWPAGYAAIDDPLRVVDESGQVLLTVGDEVDLPGTVTSQVGVECDGESAPQWSAAPVTPDQADEPAGGEE